MDIKTEKTVEAKPEAKEDELAILKEKYYRWVEARDRRIITTLAGGLIAICVVILQAFLSAGRLNIPETISIYALSIAIPLLSGGVVAATFSKEKRLIKDTKMRFMFLIGSLMALIGVAVAIYNVSWVACLLFAISTVVTFILADKHI